MAPREWNKVAILALLGALGLTLGMAIAAAVVGVSLGIAFGEWRWVATLGVGGALGFGVGLFAGTALPTTLLGRTAYVVAIAGVTRGASLGMALEYLEGRKLAEERGTTVR